MKLRWSDHPSLSPLAAQGLFFHRRSVPGFKRLPKGCFAYGAAYFPIDSDKPGQPACCLVLEVDAKRNLYLSETYQQEGLSLEDSLERLFQIHDGIERTTVMQTQFPTRANIYGVRTWHISKEQFPVIEPIFLEKLTSYRRAGRPVPRLINITPLANPLDFMGLLKVAQSEMIAGRLKVDENAPWLATFMGELCQWPAVRTDARVQALAVAMGALGDMQGPGRSEAAEMTGGSHWAA